MPTPNILFLDGFDLYNGTGLNSGLQAGWTISNGFYNPGITGGRVGGQAFFVNNDGSAIYRTVATPTATFTFACAFRCDNIANAAVPSMQRTVVTMSQAANPQIGWRHNNDGSISIYRMTSHTAGVLLFTTAPNLLKSGVWHWIDFSVTISATVGTVDLKVDNVSVCSLTAQNTQGYTTTATIDGLFFGSQADNTIRGNYTYLDDCFLTDSITPLGERRIETIRPSADTSTKMWIPNAGTTNYNRVNDNTVNTGTYVSASNVNDLDLYDMIDLNSSPTTIDAVQVTVFAQKTDAGSRSIAIVGDIAGTQIVSANLPLAIGIAKFTALLPTKPGGGAWDAASVNALRAGPKVTV